MNIYYDRKTKEWFSLSNKKELTFGSSYQPVKVRASLPTSNILSFPILTSENNVGPLIGILTSRDKNNSIVGNGHLFRELQKEIIKNGGISVVFTPHDIAQKNISGFIYSPEKNQWFSVTCPMPHLVFNRVPFRGLENTELFEETFHFFRNQHIPFFNPCFLNKYDVYQLLSKDSILKSYIPNTILATEKTPLYHFLQKYKKVYLKPAYGAKGKGIYLICLYTDGTVKLSSLKDNYTFLDFHVFWQEWEKVLKEKVYIAQKAVTPFLYNGKRFDFRILAHYSNNNYKITGTGIRQSKKQEITTHIPNGGVLIPYDQIQTRQHDEFFAMVADRAGKLLSEERGFFGEFSIDAGLSARGNYVIYEINSKPMRFDEQEIENRRLYMLTNLFREMAGFKQSNPLLAEDILPVINDKN